MDILRLHIGMCSPVPLLLVYVYEQKSANLVQISKQTRYQWSEYIFNISLKIKINIFLYITFLQIIVCTNNITEFCKVITTFCLFVLMLNVPWNIFMSCWDVFLSFWVE